MNSNLHDKDVSYPKTPEELKYELDKLEDALDLVIRHGVSIDKVSRAFGWPIY